MAIYGSNTFQWEPTVQVVKNGDNIAHFNTYRYRTKDTIISILGVELGAWSNWQWADEGPVYRLPDGTLCNSFGTPI
jgi:hypothetical protein